VLECSGFFTAPPSAQERKLHKGRGVPRRSAAPGVAVDRRSRVSGARRSAATLADEAQWRCSRSCSSKQQQRVADSFIARASVSRVWLLLLLN